MTASSSALSDLCHPLVMESPIELKADVNGWGLDNKNSRYVRSEEAGINGKNVSSLELDWAFALPDSKMPHSQPMITTNVVYIADEPGVIYALDRRSGCTRWTFLAEASVRTAIRLIEPSGSEEGSTRPLLVFGDAEAFVYAIDALSGKLVWRIKADSHKKAMISGSPAFHEGRLYVPISSWEAFWALNPFYSCCTFRSSVLALDVQTGTSLWRTYTVTEEPKRIKQRWLLPDVWGPSGAPVWSAPTIDEKRNTLYVGTGENYSSPATEMSDAIIAMDLDTGKINWHRQFLSNDAWNVSCSLIIDTNCPEENGVDLDFGAPPILTVHDRKAILLVGQKNGVVRALDPNDAGKTLWERKLGRGGKLGGVHFGMAVDQRRDVLYVPISDRHVYDLGDAEDGVAEPGLHALALSTGDTLWYAPAEPCVEDEDCFNGLSAAVTATESLVFAASLDGVLHAFESTSGARVWRYETAKNFSAVNGTAKGGSVDLGGIYLSRDQMFVTSGYEVFGQMAGNAFLALRVKQDHSIEDNEQVDSQH
ncbi:MAG: PQQ-binding-like beta-propeller repeat protein [Pseudomonadales bacterium]